MNFPMRTGNDVANLPLKWDDEPRVTADGFDLKKTLKICSGVLLGLILLSAVVPIGSAVIGSGQVGVESRVKRIAHPTGGVITEISVANGKHVEKGQLLMRLDDRVTGADAMYSNLTVEQLLAQKARLEAERLGSGRIIFPPELAQLNTDSAHKAMQDEQRMFQDRRNEEGQLRAQLQARTAQYNEQIRGFQGQIASLRRQEKLIEPERASVKELWDKQLVTINRLNELERTAAEIEGSAASLQAQIAQARARITETQEQAIQLGQTRRVQAGTDLAQVNSALNQQQLRSVSASDQKSRSEIRAPYSGTVEKLAFISVGDVVRPAETIMEIVPDRDEMLVEVAINPADVDQVQPRQEAQVRFTSFNRATTPEIPARVLSVATDRTENAESKQSFYTVRVAIDQAAVRREGLDLRNGMPAEVYIQTGSRSLISYIFKPLRDQFARAFRDN